MNEYLLQYKGKTIDERITKDCCNYLVENKKMSPAEACLVQVSDSKSKEILGLGGSAPNDLFTDQLGIWWESFMTVPSSASLIVTLKNFGGVGLGVRIRGGTFQFARTDGGAIGSEIRIGQGSTPPARTDFSIDTPFVTIPESGFINTASGAYNSGLGNFIYSALIVAGGSGTISEAGTFFRWQTTSNNTNLFMMARDLISPTVAFVAGQTITVTWTWQF